jgi:RimJ/RimL family protein N-acetyltransferase
VNSDDVCIRNFRPQDRAAVARLWRTIHSSFQPWNEPEYVIDRKQRQKDGLFFVAERNGQVVGTVAAGYDGIRGWIYSLAVAAGCRRRGIAQRLIARACEELAKAGCPKVNLQVIPGNSSAVALYHKLGFVIEDRIQMSKPLEPQHPDSKTTPVLSLGGGLMLSAVQRSDKASLLKHLNETDLFHKQMGRMPYPYTEADADQWLDYVDQSSSKRDQVWAIRQDGELIGACGLHEIGKGAEIGYWLARPFWRRGICSRAVRAVCAYAFSQLQLQKVEALVFPENAASAGMLKRLGFREEGLLRKHYSYFGTLRDVRAFGLLAEEFANS